jgi:multidrug efflux pump subunit AcrA (membrane-fusion protein)
VLKPARLLACAIFVATPAWSALPFAVAPVKYQMTDTGYSTEASVEAVRQSTLAAQVSGRVAAVNFDAGDYVKAGTVIVRLTAQELSSAVAGSRAQVAQADATLANARANYERQQQLFQQKFISQAALDRATAEFRSAEAAARAARAGAGQTVGDERLHRDHRALFRRGRHPPRRSGRNRGARHAADDRLRPQGHAGDCQHPAVQAGRSEGGAARRGRDPLAQQVDRRRRRHRAAVGGCHHPYGQGADRPADQPGRRDPRHVRPRAFLGRQRAQAHDPVERGGAPLRNHRGLRGPRTRSACARSASARRTAGARWKCWPA